MINPTERNLYQIHSDRVGYHTAKKPFFKKGTLDDVHFDSHRDISPYRIENFVDMLHKFGVSDNTIMKKMIHSPMAYAAVGHEISLGSQNEDSQLIKNVVS